uniref:DNA helicase n=1 Tax=Ananas comosus var. bracteatus TaxID=296719 RepID=A0A6V7QY61_ANACO
MLLRLPDQHNQLATPSQLRKSAQKFPFLLKHPLREYQHIGLDWLVTMYEKRLNGILADEMGLGKTIMTIALLAHLACEKGIWGPHLIVVPTSVMLNWETEFLKWCPAFKILTYFGSAKERKHKRQGWLKPNSFHVCITTYRLVIQDSKVFKRKKWKYLILDEAHLIKNWKSQRWQTLLNFNSKRRILLTGTPLQNDLMELWSLMHFLMPHIFQSHQEFKDWFSKPISGMVEGQEKVNKEVVDRLHNVLRPFILRRLKRDVEKQLPKKHEHVIYCRLSRRQRNLYEDFIASSETQATLASTNYFGMISIIMQLRKVDLRVLNLVFTQHDFNMASWEANEVAAIAASPSSVATDEDTFYPGNYDQKRRFHGTNIFEEIQRALWEERVKEYKERAASIAWWNRLRCQKKPMYGTNFRELVTVQHPAYDIHEKKNKPSCYMEYPSTLAEIVLSPVERFQKMLDLVESFMFAIPASRAPVPVCWCSKGKPTVFFEPSYREKCNEVFSPLLSPIRPAIVRRQVYFPDRRLIQFDCGKLQELAILLRRLKTEGHRALIFTQMTKMLDVLEAFINLYGYTYMRLDGSTQPEERQTLMQRFNTNPKIFLFILSTRSGGVGINLVGADTVIFYDSDWNPAMDQQAQDRCHRIGQTREVHIYRLISESTIEENILKKANQKRALDDLVIQSGSYNTEFFKKLDPIELFSGNGSLRLEKLQLSNADVEAAIKHAEDEVDYMALKKVEQEEAVDNQEFTEEAIGRLDDDELVNEDDTKLDDKFNEERKGMFLNLDICHAVFGPLDPIIDKSAMEYQVNVEEEEWELDRIEKFKEDLEAEIDEDQEPLVYERWDSDFATTAYRQHVEALAQRQLMEELEYEAQEAKAAEDEASNSCDRVGTTVERKPKKVKEEGNNWFKDSSPDSWSTQEDAILCAVVHEYGTHWSLVSDILYGVPGGGSYRGRFRHPVHCCERFRELFFKHVVSSVDSTEKVSASGKALLKVTEDQVRILLNVTSELPDNELLLQKHFFAILSSVWRAKLLSDPNKSTRLTENVTPMNTRPNSRLVMMALSDVSMQRQEEPVVLSSKLEAHINQLELTLEFPMENSDNDFAFPPSVSISVSGQEQLQQAEEPVGQCLLAASSCRIAENRFRMASEACFEGEGSLWALSSAFPTCDVSRYRAGSKSLSLGKHKLAFDSSRPPKSKVQKTIESHEEGLFSVSKCLLPSPQQISTSTTGYCINDEPLLPSMNSLFEEMGSLDLVQHEYDPSFLAGLEELELVSDFTDIG